MVHVALRLTNKDSVIHSLPTVTLIHISTRAHTHIVPSCFCPVVSAFFTEQPASVKAVEGQPISLSCSVNASSGTFNHWVFKAAGQDLYSALENETSTTLQRAFFSPNHAGDYRCQISVQEPDGIALSQPATVSYFSEFCGVLVSITS